MIEKLLPNQKRFKFDALIILMAGLFLTKIFYSGGTDFISLILNELIVIGFSYFIIINIYKAVGNRKITPLNMIASLIVVQAVFLLLALSSGIILSNEKLVGQELIIQPDTIERIIISLFNLVILVISSIYLLSFRELFFLKQKKNMKAVYIAMVVFIILAVFTSFFVDKKLGYESFSFIHYAFYVNALILMFINSLQISWIAFLKKKEKRKLILLSVLMIIIASFSVSEISGNSSYSNLMSSYSYSLYQFSIMINIYCLMFFGVVFFTTLFHLPTAEAFDKRTKEISSLQYLSRLISQAQDFKELASSISEHSVEIAESQGSWIIWSRGDGVPVAVKNAGYTDALKITKFCNKYLTGLSIKTVDLKDLYKTEITDEKYQYAIIAPLKAYGKVHGYLFNLRKNNVEFDDEDKAVLETYSDYAAVAVENSFLLKESIEKERLEKELDVAREMQRKIIPQELPSYEKVDISAVFIPAFEVGGDYYDFFRLQEDKFAFVIADVSGKGISAAFIMAELRGVFESLTKIKSNPKEILGLVNQSLRRILDSKSFISAVFGIIDLSENKVKLVRAGHCPPILLTEEGLREINPTGLGLGMTFTDKFCDTLGEAEFELKENDTLILYTDGITEAKNSDLKDFGTDALINIVKDSKGRSSSEIANEIIRSVTIHSESNPQHDDITLVVLKLKK
ncbi:MAG: SpoIIE family protein phosphatase [Ignavibacteriaceae bacterium]|nr:SpoIIE family protein phosphatase [Ignavibacteriaceae bacterium]